MNQSTFHDPPRQIQQPPSLRAITFTVYGQAQPAGSKKAMPIYRNGPNGRQLVTRANGSPMIAVTDDNPKSRDWKQQVAHAASAAYRGPLLVCPIRFTLLVVRPRPKGHFNSRGELNKSGRETPHPITKPDVLKLARAVEDAISGIVWNDDAQIVSEHLTKSWGEQAKIEVTIEPM